MSILKSRANQLEDYSAVVNRSNGFVDGMLYSGEHLN